MNAGISDARPETAAAPSFVPVAPGLYLLPVPFGDAWTGVYLSRGRETVLIDSGPDAGGVDRHVAPALAALGLRPRDIDWLLCTHTHGDHVGGHARLAALGVGGVAVIEAGAERLRDPLAASRRIRARFPEHSPPPPPGLTGVEPTRVVRDGERIGDLRVVAAPGHDVDCACFLHEGNGWLLTGDSIQGDGTAAQGCALYFDPSDYRDTLRRLSRLPLAGMAAGHEYAPWGRAVWRAPGDCLCTCLELVERYGRTVREAWRKGERDTAKLADRLLAASGGRKPPFKFMAMITAAGHRKDCEARSRGESTT